MARRVIKIDQESFDKACIQFADYVYCNPFVSTKQLRSDLNELRQSLHSDLSERGFTDRITEHIRSPQGQELTLQKFGKPICVGTIISGNQCKYFVYDTPIHGLMKFSRSIESISCIIEIVIDYRKANLHSTRWNEVCATVSKTGYPHGAIDSIINGMDERLEVTPKLRLNFNHLAEAILHKQWHNDNISINML
jgi:hypothetical protein